MGGRQKQELPAQTLSGLRVVVRCQAPGRVACSSWVNHARAVFVLLPHISAEGSSWPQTAGRAGWPKMRQRLAWSSCTQRTPAGLPCGMPGIGELMDGAMQQAPQPGRQFTRAFRC